MRATSLLTALFIFAIGTSLSAQDYVITVKGDSLAGKVKMFNFGVEKKVQVTTADKKKNNLSLFQVKMVMFENEKYVPAKGPAGYTFMKVVREGFLSLLAFQLENQTGYDGRYLQKKGGQGVEVPNLTFKKTLRNFLEDCPSLSQRIEAGEFSRNDLDRIIDEYNQCITGRFNAVQKQIAQQKQQTAKLNPWEALEEKVKSTADLEGKDNALEMITEIKGKIARAEKVPNFMVDGLRSILKAPEIQPELEAALKEIQ
ncbi:hypothetical protein DQQ10_23000 [Pseudochryseolinea flava]|uniref:DUF4369 domain-containing protein n=2 Tax=Pseudochryseolinea flava TaxID=2059302 RepID=A0A364XW53_9BACT|nr:hypothetical protein DQQ10_23000 [Pseudochryseolinea flava]